MLFFLLFTGPFSSWLEKEMATHSSILSWRIPWTEEPGRLQSMASQRVRHNSATSLHFSSWWCSLNLLHNRFNRISLWVVTPQKLESTCAQSTAESPQLEWLLWGHIFYFSWSKSMILNFCPNLTQPHYTLQKYAHAFRSLSLFSYSFSWTICQYCSSFKLSPSTLWCNTWHSNTK